MRPMLERIDHTVRLVTVGARVRVGVGVGVRVRVTVPLVEGLGHLHQVEHLVVVPPAGGRGEHHHLLRLDRAAHRARDAARLHRVLPLPLGVLRERRLLHLQLPPLCHLRRGMVRSEQQVVGSRQ